MGINPGDRISIYEVVGPLGAGAMGEVYRARDTRLDREVAIKLLPEDLADDPDRLARFEREAKLLASVNHPNIGAIHGIEDADDTRFLVLELIEGQTLGDRIAAGPIPVEEVIAHGCQIAEGLEAAHECGVVHRDLKPDNIRITPDDTVKLLDFGLAKAVAGPGSGTRPDSVGMTQSGVLLGTPYYMSPEQIRGRPVDRRADIWAFGCVLYEALTGTRAFPGETMAEVAAAVLEHGADLDALPTATPARVRALIADCLVKDARERLRDIGDARRELAAVRMGEEATSPPSSGPARRGRVVWPVAIVLAAVIVAAGLMLRPVATSNATVASQVLRFTYEIPDDLRVVGSAPPEIAPDGSMLALVGMELGDATWGVWLHRFDDEDESSWSRVENVPNPWAPRFSPDSKELVVASHVGGAETYQIKRVRVDDGSIDTILDWRFKVKDFGWDKRGSLWLLTETRLQRLTHDREIDGAFDFGLTSEGDAWHELNIAADQDLAFVTGTVITSGAREQKTVVVSLRDGTIHRLPEGLASATYFPSGHLLYAKTGSLYAQPFDVDSRTLHGKPVSLPMDHLWRAASIEHGAFRFAAQVGTLVHCRARDPVRTGRRLVVVDATAENPQVSERGSTGEYWDALDASEDGSTIISTVERRGRYEPRLFKGEVREGLDKRVLQTMNWHLCLSADAETLYGTNLDGELDRIFRVGLADPAEPTLVLQATERDAQLAVLDVSPGRLVFHKKLVETDMFSLHVLRLDPSDAKPEPLVEGKAWVSPVGGFSPPDWKRFAYTSDQEGFNEVWSRSMTKRGEAARKIERGDFLSWSEDGKTIYLISLDGWLCAVDASGRGTVEQLFDLNDPDVRWIFGDSRILPLQDGRFLLVQKSKEEFWGAREVHVIVNFPRLLQNTLSAK